MKKEEKIVLDIYRQMYLEASPSVDFNNLLEKSKIIHFDNYFLSVERQDEIIEENLKGKRLTKLKKAQIKNTVWLGCSPSSVDFHYVLERERDGLIKRSPRIRWLEFNENRRFKEWYDDIAVGRGLIMSPFSIFFTWQTTLVTEIISQENNEIKFKTENSTYKLTKVKNGN